MSPDAAVSNNELLTLLLAGAVGALLAGIAAIVWANARARAAQRAGHAAREPEFVALTHERDAAISRAEDLRSRLGNSEQELASLRQRGDELSDRCAALSAQAERMAAVERQLTVSGDELRALRGLRDGAENRAADLAARLEEQQRAADARLRDLESARERMKIEFQALAAEILEDKAKRFTAHNSEQIGGLLTPLREQLNQFRDTVTQTHATEQRERGMLFNEIQSLKQLNQQITTEASNLTRALKGDSRSQGAWGEMVLERVLEASGLQSGREYKVQTSFLDEEGGRPRPDVVVHLPDEKDLVIDAKMSLVAYERFASADDDGVRALALREHVISLKRHIDGLSARNYADLPGLRTLDFVLLFVPVEPAFIEALRADDGLYTYALSRNISLVSPSTLLATLRTVAHLWRLERRNINATEIAKRAAQLHDNFVLLVGELENIGAQLDRARSAHQSATRRLTEGGKGSVVLQVQSLADMGAPVKKTLPESLRAAAGAITDEGSTSLPPGAGSSDAD
jgi:DNA recombination protein RmuC